MAGTGMSEAPQYRRWAENLVKKLWKEDAEVLQEERLIDDAVRMDVAKIKSWYQISERLGQGMLAMKSDWARRVIIPSHAMPTSAHSFLSMLEQDIFNVWIRDIRIAYPNAVEVSPDEGRSLFLNGLMDFMVARRKGTEDLAENADRLRRSSPTAISMISVRNGVNIPGCLFSVTSNTPGLRALWSPAYGMTSNSFGHPTSPVSGYLLSGTYIFGVDGGAYVNPIWDHAQVTLPGPNTSVHLNF